jgi:hypothetical protein
MKTNKKKNEKKLSKITNTINWLHELFVIVMVFGCFINKKHIRFHIYAFPLLIMHWMTNDGLCVVSEVESKLKGSDYIYSQEDKDAPSDFMKRMYKKYDINLTGYWLRVSTITLFFISWTISAYRYYCIYDKLPFFDLFSYIKNKI